jgi:hypothetical protein
MGKIMRTKSIRLFCSAVLTGLLVTAHAVNADDVVIPTTPDDRPALVNMTGQEGFVTQLPAVDSGTLVEQLRALRSALIAHKQILAGELEAKQFDSGDAVLALVMPGGLLYAGYKKAAYARAKNNMDEVSENIVAYSDDLAVLQEQLEPITVAQVR